MRLRSRLTAATAMVVALPLLVNGLPAQASAQNASQNDGGSRRDAGNTFDKATPIRPNGFYVGGLDADNGDNHDYYKFGLREGSSVSAVIEVGASVVDPIEILDPSGRPLDVGTKVASLGVTTSPVFTGEFPTVVRVAVHRAMETGEYRLHIQSERFELRDYAICFLNCEGFVNAPQDLFGGGSLPTTGTKVLLIPPTHGDLGNPAGPTVVDYVDATLRGIRTWNDAIRAFTKDYPRYSYLRKIEIHIDVFDGVQPVDPVGYDIVLGYAAAGPAFRGVAFEVDNSIESILRSNGLEESVRFTGRAIVLSLFGSSPRVGQVLYDFPEVNDLEIVTIHEFGHTFGLGHTTTWRKDVGPDIMNSPAPFLYGDGFPGGDGGERTKMKCLSSLNLVALAHLYRWVPSGKWVASEGRVRLPADVPYKWYC